MNAVEIKVNDTVKFDGELYTVENIIEFNDEPLYQLNANENGSYLQVRAESIELVETANIAEMNQESTVSIQGAAVLPSAPSFEESAGDEPKTVSPLDIELDYLYEIEQEEQYLTELAYDSGDDLHMALMEKAWAEEEEFWSEEEEEEEEKETADGSLADPAEYEPKKYIITIETALSPVVYTYTDPLKAQTMADFHYSVQRAGTVTLNWNYEPLTVGTEVQMMNGEKWTILQMMLVGETVKYIIESETGKIKTL